jgi:hypothetical protein
MQLSPQPAEIYKNGTENGQIPAILAKKLPKTALFTQKYFIRYTPKMFFEEYINFKSLYYLRRCEVISIQSFGSQIRSQPFGLGLNQI